MLVVQTYIPAKDRKMSAEEFAAITETVEAEHRRQMDRTAPKVQELLHRGDDGLAAFAGGAGDLATGEVIPLGTFGSGRDRISTAVIQKKQSASSRDGADHLQILTTSFVLVRGKVVFLYAYREYEGPPDLRAAKSITTRWVESVVAAN